MPKMKRALLVLAVLSLTTLSGCAALQNLLKGAFKKPTVTFKTARLADASLSDATVNLVYEVSNPNGFGLDLASVDYAFFVEGKQVVAGKPKKGLNLKANGKSELVFPANVKFADIVPVVETFLNKDRAAFKAQGTVGIKTPIGVIDFPLSKEGTFEVPKIPQVAFQAPRIKNITLSGATVEFPLEIKNRNSFPLPVAGITGALKVAGADVGTLSTGSLGMLDGSGSKQVTLPLTINFARAASAAMALRSGGNAQVRLDGKLTSDDQSVPLNLSQLVNFVK
ncbi:LEA type 2 family protein [Myxococcus sp. RHSTA-1-4]|uniref:LEA type 2 family protein n=1 Tax=Myxococcus sp. RHSTA-1-4 TaxID=2874601 RepID=UPI001CBD3273|nr:LEA type 2 family protein [Myxococcus sp. RHSTA-1-4]MBZ4418065.1 LEA type 2 family protein [Myxococcus sp. RHSTA-1-4]